jgi:hypothetical protein
MRVAHFIAWLALSVLPAACNQEPAVNVNSRYTVESIEISPRAEARLSDSLKLDLKKLVGEKFNQETVDKIVRRIRKELSGYRVVQRIAKGTNPESIRLIVDVVRAKREKDVVLPRLVYHSKENFTFGADGAIEHGGNRLTFGILTDNDELLERYSGIRGGYQRTLAGGRFRGGFVVESFRAQWNGATTAALARQPEGGADNVPGIYRTRLHIQPDVQVEFLPGVTWSGGFSLQRFQTQFPAARFERSQALITSLRLNHEWDLSASGKHMVEAGYSLRAATKGLGSDYSYTRQFVNLEYGFRRGREAITATFLAGWLNGQAPLFERFLLGNSTTLRGYNKYDIDPLGGNRMAHGSVDYRHRWVRVVYDTGVVYDRGGVTKVRHSLAAGLTTGQKRDSLSFLVAFPLREGRMEPIFIVGMNF